MLGMAACRSTRVEFAGNDAGSEMLHDLFSKVKQSVLAIVFNERLYKTQTKNPYGGVGWDGLSQGMGGVG